MLLLRYEDLQANLTAELHKISYFLKLNSSNERVNHASRNSEGEFHRKHHAYNYREIYNEHKELLLNQTMEYTNRIISDKFDNLGFYR